MCGVVGGVGEPSDAAVAALRHRGPDAEAVVRSEGFWLGHTRLSVIDPGAASDQPFRRGAVTLVFNGEIWNYRELREELRAAGARFRTAGDTEVLAAALERWGEAALPRLQGMFAVAWTCGDGTLRLARDRHGEVPLHVSPGPRFLFASELKALDAAGAPRASWGWVEPGELLEAGPGGLRRRRWYDVPRLQPPAGAAEARAAVRAGVALGAAERAVSDVPVCTLLSGGIDSAVVAAHLRPLVPGLVAYVAVMDERSPDLRAAREVAAHLGLELREVRVEAPSADDLERVVRAIEMPHKAQVEIGWACLRLAERIRADGFKVTFSGEGSDELWASYGFAYHGVRQHGWGPYRRKLFREQHRKNFARCNKVFMAHGVECRLPFLSTGLVETALSLPVELVQDGKARPKAVLQDSHADLLPERVVRRPKLAFQDGMGLKAACAAAVHDPAGFYRAVYSRDYG